MKRRCFLIFGCFVALVVGARLLAPKLSGPIYTARFADGSRVEVLALSFEGKITYGNTGNVPVWKKKLGQLPYIGKWFQNLSIRGWSFCRSSGDLIRVRCFIDRIGQAVGFDTSPRIHGRTVSLLIRRLGADNQELDFPAYYDGNSIHSQHWKAPSPGKPVVVKFNETDSDFRRLLVGVNRPPISFEEVKKIPFLVEISDTNGETWQPMFGPQMPPTAAKLALVNSGQIRLEQPKFFLRFTQTGQPPVSIEIPNPKPTQPAVWTAQPIGAEVQLTECSLKLKSSEWSRYFLTWPVLLSEVEVGGEKARFFSANRTKVVDRYGNELISSCSPFISPVQLHYSVSRGQNYPIPLDPEKVLVDCEETDKGITFTLGPLAKQLGMQKFQIRRNERDSGSDKSSFILSADFRPNRADFDKAIGIPSFVVFCDGKQMEGKYNQSTWGNGFDRDPVTGLDRETANFESRWIGDLPRNAKFQFVRPPSPPSETAVFTVDLPPFPPPPEPPKPPSEDDDSEYEVELVR